MTLAVEDHATARIVTDAPQFRSVRVALRYDPVENPDAVSFAFPSGRDWTFPARCWRRGSAHPPASAMSRYGPAAGSRRWWSSIPRTA